jgi:exosortase F-associated protein
LVLVDQIESPSKIVKALRSATVLLTLAGLVTVFLFQQTNVAALCGITPPGSFYFNRTIRFLVNDGLTIGLIWAVFEKRKYVVFALWVQVFGFFFFLLPYFALKLFFTSYNGPLLSFIHRLIFNPTLLLLLIPALYYQERMKK